MTQYTRGAKAHKSNRDIRHSQKDILRRPVTGDNVPFTTSAAPLPDITELTAEHILYLQRTVGNSTVARLLERTRTAGQPATIVERHLPAGNEQPAIVQRDASDESTGLESAKFSGDPVLEATFRGERFIMQGSQGSAVQRVQEALESVNFPLEVFGTDGIFGSETRQVVSAYQMAHDITKDGRPYGFVGPRTVHGLDQELAGKEPQPEDDVFFQDLLDFLAERGEERFPYLQKLRNLCQAVHERQSKAIIRSHVRKVTQHKGRYGSKNDVSTLPDELISVDFRSELTARMYMRGLNNDANEVWTHLVEVREAELPGAHKDENQNAGAHHLTFWKKAVEQAKAEGNLESATNAAQSVEELSRALDGIAYGFITYGDMQLYSPGSRLLGEELLLLIKEVVPIIQTGIQTIVDTALNELGEGDARTLNVLRDVVKKGEFRQAFDRIVRNPVLADLELETSKSTFKATGGTHHDYFATDKEKKAADLYVNYYDNNQEMAELTEMQSSMRNIYVARERQVDLLDEIYGGLDNSGMDKDKLTDSQTANAAAIETMGDGFHLRSDDNWQEFLLTVLEQQDKPDIRELIYLYGAKTSSAQQICLLNLSMAANLARNHVMLDGFSHSSAFRIGQT